MLLPFVFLRIAPVQYVMPQLSDFLYELLPLHLADCVVPYLPVVAYVAADAERDVHKLLAVVAGNHIDTRFSISFSES